MKTKRLNWKIIKYELLNLLGNPFVAFFGVIFPVMMSAIISNALHDQVPESFYPQADANVFITIIMVIPMAVVFLGYAANYSQELEKEIPLRMSLFGFRERTMLTAKMISHIVFMTAGLIIYTIFAYCFLELHVPQVKAALALLLCLYLMGAIFFILSHAIANIFKKFGPTYSIVMGIYFLFMLLSGMMGVEVKRLPKPLRIIADLLPMSYVSSDFGDFWESGTYNAAPLIQSFLLFGAVAGILLLYSVRKNRRVMK